jgi:hypothetical protein
MVPPSGGGSEVAGEAAMRLRVADGEIMCTRELGVIPGDPCD